MKDLEGQSVSKSQNQNQLQLLSEEEDEVIKQQAANQSFYPSQLTQSLYKPIVAGVNSLPSQQITLRLKSHEIQFQKNNFSSTFQKLCIKTDWESTVYQIKYGNFKTNLKIIVIKMEPKILCNQLINKGNFGEILSFQLQRTQPLALKNIKFKPEITGSIDLALRQVFMAKLFSALEAGPKFSKIFSYDAIIYQGSVQFAMEMCDRNYSRQQIQNELANKNLLIQLKNIHKLKICHLDIKYENIGWSPAFGKFIFLDFSFTINIRQPIGYKTMTKFLGTYNYTSPEMKKIFFLKESAYIDLYYNDLHCLEEIWKDFAQNRHKKSEQLLLPFKPKARQITPDATRIDDNMAIVRYFDVKMSIFEEKYDNLKEIIEKERILVKTLRKLTELNVSMKAVDSSQFKILHDMACNNPQQLQQDADSKIDEVLLSYEMEKYSKQSITSFFETILKICDSNQLFLKLWQEELWRERIFFFIDVYSNPQKQEPRKNLINKIYSNLEKGQSKKETISDTMKLRSVLMYYSEFFREKKNIIILEKILTYFLMFKDYMNTEKIQSYILDLWEQEEKYDDYVRENFKYFLGKAAVLHRQFLSQSNSNVSRLSTLLEKMNSNPTKFSPEMIEKIQNVTDLMIILQNINFKMYSESWTVQAKKLIEARITEFAFGSEINQFLSLNLGKMAPAMSYSFSKKKTFDNIFLEKCSFQKEIQQLLRSSKIITYRHFLQNEDLTKQFPLFYKTHYLSFFVESERKLMCQILTDYLSMNADSCLIIHPEYFYAVSFSTSISEAMDRIVAFLASLELEKLNNLQKIMFLKMMMPLYLTSYLGFAKQQSCNVSTDTVTKLNNLIQTLVDTTSNIQNFRQKCDYSLALLQVLNKEINKDLFEKNHDILRIILLLSKGKQEQALDFLFQIVQENEQILAQMFKKNLFSLINENILKRKIFSFQTQVLSIGKKFLEKQKAQYYLNQPKFIINILEILRVKKQFGQIIFWVSRLCEIIHIMNFPFLKVRIVEIMDTFIKSCSASELEMLMKQGLSMQLKCFANFPTLIYLIALAHFKLESLKVGYHVQKNRFIITCAAFVDHLKQGYFRRLKVYIGHQVEEMLVKKPTKLKKALRRNRNIGVVKDLLGKIRQKYISRQALEAIRQAVRSRVRLLLKNQPDYQETPYLQLFQNEEKVPNVWDFFDA